MRVLDLGVSPTVLVEDNAAAEAWMNARKMKEQDKEFLRWNFRWIEVLTVREISNI